MYIIPPHNTARPYVKTHSIVSFSSHSTAAEFEMGCGGMGMGMGDVIYGDI